ncbi:MAG TPA: NADPH:quinone reductase, partial [Gammaproteobacteria bacterium]|nr:NADPH:quinone reductase [Gammaproteobacteria bacterium]
MKAVWYESIGEAEQVLNYGDLEDPQINDGEVLVKLNTSGVNPSDVKIRAGARGELQFPRIIPHSDGGGIIVEVGEEVSEDRIGERVWIWNGAFGRAFGTCAELIVLPSSQAVAMPENVSFETAACLGIPASTAYYGIFADGPVKDQTILITGGAGAVGYLGIQLAKWSGAHVISTVSGDDKATVAEAAGADLVVNYKTDNVIKAVNDFTKGHGVDRILEVEFGGNLSVSEHVIKNNGVIAAYGSVTEANPSVPFYNLMFKSVKLNTYLIYIVADSDRANINQGINAALSDNALTPIIAKSFQLSETVNAHQSVEEGSIIGNVV